MYSDKNYFLTKIKAEELNNLTESNDSNLSDAIAAADSLINGYLKKVVKVLPLNPVPEIIKQTSYQLALYYLHDRIQYTDIPGRVKLNYDNAVAFLIDVASGKANIHVVEDDNLNAQIEFDGDENVFNRSTF
jgi:phage gp36-like protein